MELGGGARVRGYTHNQFLTFRCVVPMIRIVWYSVCVCVCVY